MSTEINKKNQSFEISVVHRPKKLSSAFSPRDKLFLLCSPLGGYSLLDDTKYHISFMKRPPVSRQGLFDAKKCWRGASNASPLQSALSRELAPSVPYRQVRPDTTRKRGTVCQNVKVFLKVICGPADCAQNKEQNDEC